MSCTQDMVASRGQASSLRATYSVVLLLLRRRLLLVVPAAQAAQAVHWRAHLGCNAGQPSADAALTRRPALRLLRQLPVAAGPRQRQPRRQLLPILPAVLLLVVVVLLLERGRRQGAVGAQVAGSGAGRVGQALRQRVDGLRAGRCRGASGLQAA